MAFDKGKYDAEYNRTQVKCKRIPFNKNNPDDMELLEWLEKHDNVTQYVKELIREDFEEHKSRVAYEQHTHEVAKTLEGLKIPLIDGYENKEAIDLAVKESHNLYIGWYEDYEYRIDTDTKTVLTVRKRI